jgi:succinyl-CoA synthetase beta subunit
LSDDVLIEKLGKIFYECDKHLIRINLSHKELEDIMPLDSEKYINLNDEDIKVLDQFLFRFSKLQDAMGQRLFKTILSFLKEDIENLPFIDVLNRMEKIGLLDSANVWKELREDRNELAHNYEDEPDKMSETINVLYNKKIVLENIYNNIKEYYSERQK